MARSLKKGPYVDAILEKKILKAIESNKKVTIKTWSRRSTALVLFRPSGRGQGVQQSYLTLWGRPLLFIMGIDLFLYLSVKIW